MWFSARFCCGFVVVVVACPGHWPLGLGPPSHFRFGFACFLFLWLVARPFSVEVCGSVSGVPFSRALWRPWGRGDRLLLAGFCPVGRGGPSVFYRGVVPWLLPLALPGWGVARLLWSGCAALRLCDCLPLFLLLSHWGAGARSWLDRGFPPFQIVFYGGGLRVSPSASPGLVHALPGNQCGCWCCGWRLAVPRPHGSGGLCTRLAWWPVLSG